MDEGEESGRGRARRLVAVVVTHDRLVQLRETVARLLAAPQAELAALVVIDNASTDGTSAWLSGLDDPRLDIRRCEVNCGGAGGFEMGLRAALADHAPDWVVVMDDDARPAPGALAAFHAAEPERWDGLAAAVYYPDGRICEMNRPSVNPFWSARAFLRTLRRGRDGYHIPRSDYAAETPREIDLTSFVGLFLSREIVERAGLPQGRLFLYGDDVIYTLGLRRRGGRLAFHPGIRFEHDCATFADDRRRAFRPLWKVYYTYRNGLIMYRTAAGPLFWLLVPLLAAKWRLAANRYGADRRVYLRLMRNALGDGLLGRVRREHGEVMALAAPEAGLSGSGSPGETAPSAAIRTLAPPG